MGKFSLPIKLLRAKRLTGRSYMELVSEIFRLRWGAGKLGASEYFDYRLYENDLTPDEKLAFCGYRGQAMLENILVDTYSAILSLDKITFYQLMRGYGFPVPALYACYTEKWRTWPGRCLYGKDDLKRYLLEEAVFPLYLKPSYGSYGRGNTHIVSLDGEDLMLGDGSRVSAGAFCAGLQDETGLGWVLQEVLLPHPDIARVCGNRVSSIRIHPFLGRDGVTVHRVVWKVNVGRRDSDNFEHGASGNMLADVDLATGLVTRVVAGLGFDQREIRQHPLTHEPLIGFKVPWFHESLELARQASLLFPGFICPGWDIALCERGPVALEINMFGDADLPQHSMRKGFMDGQLFRLMRERGMEGYMAVAEDPGHVTPTGRRGKRREHWNY